MDAYGTFRIDFPNPGDNEWDWAGADTFSIKIYQMYVDALDGDNIFLIRDVRLEVDYLNKSPETLVYSMDNDTVGNHTLKETLRQIDASGVVAGTHFYDSDTIPYLHVSTTNRDQSDQWQIIGH
ncbi:unnamed protein product, partial [marine sediment metagenome]